MPRILIRTDTEPPEEFAAAFPHLAAQRQAAAVTLTGQVLDLHDLQAILNNLDMLGIHVSEVITLSPAEQRPRTPMSG